jgi:hypothetical protein
VPHLPAGRVHLREVQPMTARATVALAATAAVMLALLVAKVMAVSTLAGTLLLCALGIAGLCLTARLIGPAKGEHAVPRGYAEADERLADTSERVIPRAPTEHEPPWDPAPAFQAAPVIEPAAVTHGPPQPEPEPEPEPDAYWVAAGTYNRATGEARAVRVELLPPVAELLGHASTGDAVESMCAEWHSVASIFNGAHVRQVRELLAGES